MIKFTTKIKRFAKKGEKTGWSYIEISTKQAESVNPGVKKTYRVKGMLDDHPIQKVAILPMGTGGFILPFNASMRKATQKQAGDTICVQVELDQRQISPSSDFMKCLKDDARALAFFQNLPKGHQNYFSKWIDSAKTIQTKTKRITMAVIALSSGHGFSEMLRAGRAER
jgi:hypothetical protein